MKRRSGNLLPGAAAVGMLCLILDSRCASASAQEALNLCLRTVIPGLFPMFVLSGILVGNAASFRNRLLEAAESYIGLPRGGGMLFLLGILGGFPVGAQCIAQAVEAGQLSRESGRKMLGFCNNCSPAFLFGILGSLFTDPWMPLWIFLIQAESAMLCACAASCAGETVPDITPPSVSLAEAVSRAVGSITSVCAWVILAGVVNGFLERWLFPLLPLTVSVLLTGMLEVTNGVLGLISVRKEGLRFALCAVFVCFGGCCVWMQIQSVAVQSGISADQCVRQKLLQGLLGGILGWGFLEIGAGILVIPVLLIPLWKKAVEISRFRMYNYSHKGGMDHVIP